MTYPPLGQFLRRSRSVLAGGPVSILVAEDAIELASSVHHHLDAGFAQVIVLAPARLAPAWRADLPAARVHPIACDTLREGAAIAAINALILAARPGLWLHYGYNAEYLFTPFCESRSVGEMLAFHTDERRDAMFATVIDLYAGDLARAPSGVDLGDAWMDRMGYHALDRRDPAADGAPHARQIDLFGGLRWRFDDRVPAGQQRIDRIALFRARPELHLRADHTFSIEEYNTLSCPWHHNLTAAIPSFRAAKALVANASPAAPIRSFRWPGSIPFSWSSTQLLDLGMMEPGQWF